MGQRGFECAKDRSVERRVDDYAAFLTYHSLSIEGRGDGLCEKHGRKVIRDRRRRLHGRRVRRTRQVEQSPIAHTEEIETGPFRVRSGLAEDRHASVDEIAVHVGGTEVPSFHGAGTKVLTKNVGPTGEFAKELLAGGMAQIEGDALAISVLGREEE